MRALSGARPSLAHRGVRADCVAESQVALAATSEVESYLGVRVRVASGMGIRVTRTTEVRLASQRPAQGC